MVKVNGEIFSPDTFHNGETIYKIPNVNADTNEVELAFETDADITKVLFATHYIRDKQPKSELNLKMLYIPYSRMDREIPEGCQLFSMKYFMKIINACNFDSIVALDPHSNVSEDLLDRLLEVDLVQYVERVVERFKPDYIFYPDKGANEKYTKILSSINVPHFYGTKKRDLANRGKIIEDRYELHNAPELMNKNILIVDDLVSLGGTAFVAGKTLKQYGACRVALYVSHCENGVFYGKLLKGDPDSGFKAVDKVYTAATTPLEMTHENLEVIHINE